MTKSHIVPKKALLSGFVNSKGEIYQYEKKKNCQPICSGLNGVAYENNFYTEIIPDGTTTIKDTTSLEKRLNEEAEIPFQQVVENLRKGETISQDEIPILAKFISVQFMRTRRVRSAAESYISSLNIPPEIASLMKRFDLADDNLSRNLQTGYLNLVLDKQIRLEQILLKFEWKMISVRSEEEGFLIGDNPVIWPFETGLKPPYGQIMMPISPMRVIWGGWKKALANNSSEKKPNSDYVKRINTRTVMQANRFVWFWKDSQEISELIDEIIQE